MKKEIITENAPKAIGPYSQGIVCGNLVFTSGQIPADSVTGEIVQGIEAQAVKALQNLQSVIESSGSSMDKVIKVTVFLKDINDFATVNEKYGRFFQKPYPARSCVEVSRLPKDVLIEIEAIAEL